MSCNASSNAPQNDNPSLSIAFTNGNRRSASDALSPRRNDWDVAALCLCSLANAFVLINVFPYSGFMVLFLLPSTTPETTGTYAGFLASSFMIGRCVTAVEWGKIADRYGRVCVLQASLVLSAVFFLPPSRQLVVGSTNFLFRQTNRHITSQKGGTNQSSSKKEFAQHQHKMQCNDWHAPNSCPLHVIMKTMKMPRPFNMVQDSVCVWSKFKW